MNQSTSAVSESQQNQRKKPEAATRWRKLLEDQHVSGLPITAFCRERGIAASSLFAWRRRLTRGSEETFKPVTVVADAGRRRREDRDDAATGAIELPAASFIELCLRGERRLIVRPGFDRQLLHDVLRALEGEPSRLESLS